MANYASSYTGAQTNAAIQRILNGGILLFQDVTIATSAWTNTGTYSQYPYKATALCTGCTSDQFPEVVFNLDDAISGYFAPICNSVTDGVEIFASDIPSGAITIPTIKCTGAI